MVDFQVALTQQRRTTSSFAYRRPLLDILSHEYKFCHLYSFASLYDVGHNDILSYVLDALKHVHHGGIRPHKDDNTIPR